MARLPPRGQQSREPHAVLGCQSGVAVEIQGDHHDARLGFGRRTVAFMRPARHGSANSAAPALALATAASFQRHTVATSAPMRLDFQGQPVDQGLVAHVTSRPVATSSLVLAATAA